MKIRSNWKRYNKVPSDIRESKIRDWYGNPIYRSKVNIADKKNIIMAFKREAELCGISKFVKVSFPQEELSVIKKKVEQQKQKDKEKVQDFLDKDKKAFK